MAPNKSATDLVRTSCQATLLLASVVILVLSPYSVCQDLILQKCLPKADMENITIKCNGNELIAIKAAFFTSSVVDQCPFAYVNRSQDQLSSNEVDHTAAATRKRSCTDDLRITLNSRCSGRSNCSVNLRKAHLHQCAGFDGWINIKYTCVSESRMHSYCNLDLSDNFGYVTNPGYPKFYPPYVCKWKIKASEGQRIEVNILDLSIKEPRPINRKVSNFECNDYLAIIEENAKVATLCGEVKSNLIEYRSKSDQLMVEFVSYDFSPTRGVLFKYALLNCPTLKPPSNGHMYRNGSYAYYSCHFDYVFEDTGLPTRVLYCEYDTYWNGSVARCVAKENVTVMAYALTHQETGVVMQSEKRSEAIKMKPFNKGLVTPILLLVVVLVVVVAIILVLIKLRQKSANRTAV